MDIDVKRFYGNIAQYSGEFLLLTLQANRPKYKRFKVIMLAEETDKEYTEEYIKRSSIAKKYNLSISLIVFNKWRIGKIASMLQTIQIIKKINKEENLFLLLPEYCSKCVGIDNIISREFDVCCRHICNDVTKDLYSKHNNDIYTFVEVKAMSLQDSIFTLANNIYTEAHIIGQADEPKKIYNIIGSGRMDFFLYNRKYTLILYPCPKSNISIRYKYCTELMNSQPIIIPTTIMPNEYETIYYNGVLATIPYQSIYIVPLLWPPNHYRNLLHLHTSNILSLSGTYFVRMCRDILAYIMNYEIAVNMTCS